MSSESEKFNTFFSGISPLLRFQKGLANFFSKPVTENNYL
jgi:hypothetical protein